MASAHSSAAERQLLERLDAAPTPLAQLQACAKRRGDHPAIVFLRSPDDQRPIVFGYDALLQEAKAIIKSFRKLGFGPADAVAILLPTIPQAVCALLAATSAAVAFPMNLLLTSDALAAQMDLANVKLVFTIGAHPQLDIRRRVDEAVLRTRHKPLIVEVPLDGQRHGGMSWNEFCALGAKDEDVEAADSKEAGALFHTGGTTGNPKLAQLSRRNFAAGALQAAVSLGWVEGDRVACGLPTFHVGGAIDVIAAVLTAGGTVILPTALGMRDPAVVAAFWSILTRVEATAIAAVPTSLAALAASPPPPAAPTGIRGIMTGGSPIATDLLRRIEDIVGCAVCQLYGMTETAGIASAQTLEQSYPQPCVGYAAPLVRIRIGSVGEPPTPGTVGDVYISGPNTFQGYRTRDGFDRAPADGWVHSGDIGEILADGTLKINGRSKDIIIRGGHNIDPLMIEEAAMSHPAIIMAAAVGMPNEYAGELPVLFAMKNPQAAFDEDEMRDFLARHISDPPARPKQIFILEQLPLTPLGKIARYRLRQMAVEHLAAALLSASEGFEAAECVDPLARRVRLRFGRHRDAPSASAIAALGRMGLEVEFV